MKILQTIQKRFATLGIHPSSQSTHKLPFSDRVLLGSSIFGYLIASQFVYLLRVASIFMEYMECISSTFSSTIMFVCFAAMVFRRTTLFKSIADIEKFIATSESRFGVFAKSDFILFPNCKCKF